MKEQGVPDRRQEDCGVRSPLAISDLWEPAYKNLGVLWVFPNIKGEQCRASGACFGRDGRSLLPTEGGRFYITTVAISLQRDAIEKPVTNDKRIFNSCLWCASGGERSGMTIV